MTVLVQADWTEALIKALVVLIESSYSTPSAYSGHLYDRIQLQMLQGFRHRLRRQPGWKVRGFQKEHFLVGPGIRGRR